MVFPSTQTWISEPDSEKHIVEMINQHRYIEAFDLALVQTTNPNTPEYQRKNHYAGDWSQLLLVNGGVAWDEVPDDNSLTDSSCLDVLGDPDYATQSSVVVACLLRLIGRARK